MSKSQTKSQRLGQGTNWGQGGRRHLSQCPHPLAPALRLSCIPSTLGTTREGQAKFIVAPWTAL